MLDRKSKQRVPFAKMQGTLFLCYYSFFYKKNGIFSCFKKSSKNFSLNCNISAFPSVYKTEWQLCQTKPGIQKGSFKMKRKNRIAITLCAVMALSLAACGSTNKPSPNADADTENYQQIPNPFVPCATLEEARQLTGFGITIPEDIEDYESREISVLENEMIQVMYQDGEEQLCFRKGTGSEDISGDYNIYSENTKEFIDNAEIEMSGNNGTISLVKWTDSDYSYSIFSTTGLDKETMISYVSVLNTSSIPENDNFLTALPSKQ